MTLVRDTYQQAARIAYAEKLVSIPTGEACLDESVGAAADAAVEAYHDALIRCLEDTGHLASVSAVRTAHRRLMTDG